MIARVRAAAHALRARITASMIGTKKPMDLPVLTASAAELSSLV